MPDANARSKAAQNAPKQSAQQIMDTAADAVKNATEYVKDQTARVSDAVSKNLAGAGTYLEEQAQSATEATSGGFKSVARSIREYASSDGTVGNVATGVAQKFSDAAGYLDHQGANGMIHDFTSLVKGRPIPSLIVGIALGFLLGKALESRS